MSVYVDFDLSKIYQALNGVEGLIKSSEQWGGSNTVGGSPRNNGTTLSLKEIYEILEETLK